MGTERPNGKVRPGRLPAPPGSWYAPCADADGLVDPQSECVRRARAAADAAWRAQRRPKAPATGIAGSRFALSPAAAHATVAADPTRRPDLAGLSRPLGTPAGAMPATQARQTAPTRPRARPLACGCPGAAHGPRCLIPPDYDPAEGWDADAGSTAKAGCGCAAVKVRTGPWAPEPVATPYNPLLSRRARRVIRTFATPASLLPGDLPWPDDPVPLPTDPPPLNH